MGNISTLMLQLLASLPQRLLHQVIVMGGWVLFIISSVERRRLFLPCLIVYGDVAAIVVPPSARSREEKLLSGLVGLKKYK